MKRSNISFNLLKENFSKCDEDSFYRVINHLRDAALSYARKGWRVLPVSDTKVPLIKGWPQFASTNPEQIEKWWKQFPTANVGIATGPESGIWVIDIDIKHNVNGWDSVLDTFGVGPYYEGDYCVQSASGGFHFYYKWDESLPVTVAANVLPGVDIRGETGFIIAPPSMVEVDRSYMESYQLLGNYSKAVQEAPEWAKEVARMSLNPKTPGGGQKASQRFDVAEVMKGVDQGNRDTALFKYAWHLSGCNVPYDLAEGFVLEACNRCTPPFEEAVALEKLQRVYAANTNRKQIFSLEGGAA